VSRKPVAYLRRSNAGGHNGNGRVSFDVQREAVLALAARHGDPEPELIVEWGVSGAAAAGTFGGTGRGGKRKAYHELRQRIEGDQVSALYAYSLSRLARSTRALLDLAESCAAHGVSVRLAKEGDLDFESPTGRMYLTILAAVSTFEAEVSAERARDRNEQMRERGGYVGRNPYGYLIAPDGQLVPDPIAMPIVKKVLKLYGTLKSPARVARALNEARIAAPQGGRWADGTIRRILARQPGHRPPQTVRGSRAVAAARFSRLLVCPHDGSLLTPGRKRYRTARDETKEWIGYTCSAARYDRRHPRPRMVAERVVTEWATVEVERFYRHLPERVEIEHQAESKRVDAEARRERVIDALEAGTITRAEAEPRLARIAADLVATDVEMEVLDVPRIDWNRWPPEQVNRVLHTFWNRVELDAALHPIRAEWAIPPEYVS
jgi:DNA invertase Pin-like site-specific DNA recombinase